MRKFSRHRPPTAYLSLPEAVQASFGLTQAQLAQLLGVSRATLSLEGRPTTTAVRGLPAAAVGRLAALQQLLPAPYGPAPVPSAR